MADADERAHERRIEELLRANNTLLERARAAEDECRMLSGQVTALDAKLAEISEWRPIETAPKDRPILLYRPSRKGAEIRVGRWVPDYADPRSYWMDCPEVSISFSRQHPPTHWLPLPEPPHG